MTVYRVTGEKPVKYGYRYARTLVEAESEEAALATVPDWRWARATVADMGEVGRFKMQVGDQGRVRTRTSDIGIPVECIKRTKTQLTVWYPSGHKERFNITTGKRIGQGGSFYTDLLFAYDESYKAWAEKRQVEIDAERRYNELRRKVRNVQWHYVSADKLERITTILDEE